MKTNLLPVMEAWVKENNAAATVQYFNNDPYGCQWTAASEDDRIYIQIRSNVAGKVFELYYKEFSSADGKTWLLIRSYTGGKSVNLLSATSVKALSQTYRFTVPVTCEELRIYFRHDRTSSGDPASLMTVREASLTEIPLSYTALHFHKVLPDHLPDTVIPGEEHIYYTSDGTTAKQYISTQNGTIIPVSGSSPQQTAYENAETQRWIDERMDDILSLLKKGNCIMFAIATDIHVRIEDGDDGRYKQVRDFLMLSRQLPLDYICCLGDIMSYCQDWKGREPRIEKVRSILDQAACPWFATRGNHDHNSDDNDSSKFVQVFDKTTANNLCVTNEDWHRSMTARLPKPVKFDVVFDEEHPTWNYYYVDDYALKHRMIFCDSEEVQEDEFGRPWLGDAEKPKCFINGMKTEHQILWLVNKAMDMSGKTDWTVSFFSHTIPYTDPDGETAKEFHGYGGDNPSLRRVIKAFQEGTSIYIHLNLTNIITHTKSSVLISMDFTSQGPIAVTGWFGGHIHDDCYAKVDGMNFLVSTCTANMGRKDYWNDATPVKYAPERNGKDKAMSVNLIIINKNTRTVHVVKVGSKRDNAVKTSSDLTFTY